MAKSCGKVVLSCLVDWLKFKGSWDFQSIADIIKERDWLILSMSLQLHHISGRDSMPCTSNL